MPKDVNQRSSRRSRAPHFHPYSPQGKPENPLDEASVNPKEWEDATCPICMEFPHNAVLLLCSSHDNGCRPYMCDTSYRHSNCLDQYRKLSGRGAGAGAGGAGQSSTSRGGGGGGGGAGGGDDVIHEPVSAGGSSARTRERSAVRMRPLRELLLLGENGSSDSDHGPGRAVRGLPTVDVEQQQQTNNNDNNSNINNNNNNTINTNNNINSNTEVIDLQDEGDTDRGCDSEESLDLLCPLCRGKVVGWKVVEQARRHLNSKKRNCAQESCGFTGSYDELRKHARCVHPFARPSDVDPARQRDWRHLERERDIGDVLSTIQSAMPGARILGDYVIDEDNDDQEDEGEDNDFPGDDGNWWTVFLLFQVFGPVASGGAGAGGSSIPTRLRGLSRHHNRGGGGDRGAAPATTVPPRQQLWGEEIQLNQADEDVPSPTPEDDTSTAGGPSGEVVAAQSTREGGASVHPVATRRRSRSRHHHHHQH